MQYRVVEVKHHLTPNAPRRGISHTYIYIHTRYSILDFMYRDNIADNPDKESTELRMRGLTFLKNNRAINDMNLKISRKM